MIEPVVRESVSAMVNQRGSSLIEVLVAISIFGTIAVVFLSALSTGLFNADKINERAVAENLAQNQIEYIRSQPYSRDNLYPVTSFVPSEYTVIINAADVSPVDYTDSLQKVTVSVYRGERSVLKLETYKANR